MIPGFSVDRKRVKGRYLNNRKRMKRKENKGVQKKDKRVVEKNGIKRTSQPFYTVFIYLKVNLYLFRYRPISRVGISSSILSVPGRITLIIGSISANCGTNAPIIGINPWAMLPNG